ncbi:MGMT family protein [Kineosporia sp. J2-2]|uniref:MGMT family protein n=1 Tax=Kineosporia corallincola TaxID=2835133 RepID=A0ABS5TJY0_9ACTN|nr:MGMT family protein [Kineosporia corallincola]MBT0770368.1 MGMT family protein [Kineosporia corallincola]
MTSAPEREAFVADVLEVVEAIPPGRVLTYGDVAGLVGRGGPRQVGKVMSQWGSLVPWWRVLRAGGLPPTGHESRALERYLAEGTPLRPDGERVDLRLARWSPESD